MVPILFEACPQPSGRACDVKEQSSARGRLRAADRSAIEFADKLFHHNSWLRAAGPDDRDNCCGEQTAGISRNTKKT